MISADPSAEAAVPDEVCSAWAVFLGRWYWDWFVTLTFKEPPHPEQADKLYRVWVSKINRKLYGVRWAKHGKGVRWARATELQRRGAIHFHALMGGDGLSTERRLSWMDAWHALGGVAGFARIEVPENQGAVLGYCSKYVAKGGNIDLSPTMGQPVQRGMFLAPPFRCATHRKGSR